MSFDEWTVVPATTRDIEHTAQYCRKMVRKKATIAAGIAAVPLPGLDLITDVGMLTQLFQDINKAFGLTPDQIEKLSPHKKVYAYKAISAVGGFMVGKVIKKELIIKLLKMAGVRLSAGQLARFVPLAGQALSAAMTYSALSTLCEQHIKQCMEVSDLIMKLPSPLPEEAHIIDV